MSNVSRKTTMSQTILRLPSVMARSGYSRSTIYLRMAQGLWPKQVSLGARSVGWPEYEVEALNAARIAAKGDNDIRLLVVQLEADRVTGRAGARG
jgi:prophage regulatory protein